MKSIKVIDELLSNCHLRSSTMSQSPRGLVEMQNLARMNSAMLRLRNLAAISM